MVVRAVFLDRDGVINANVVRDGRPLAPTSLEEFQILPGAADAARRLKAAGFLLVVVTNQPDVRTGLSSLDLVESMHEIVRSTMKVDAIKACFHVDEDQCACRKPKPGMLLEAKEEYGIDLRKSYIVGDRASDIQAGHAVGCLTILVDHGYRRGLAVQPHWTVGSLAQAADVILEQADNRENRKYRMGVMEKPSVDRLNIQIYADGADLGEMKKSANDPLIRGFTTNPTLMAKAGVGDFKSFALKVLEAIGDKPVSFEVIADDLPTMEAQAREIASWGANVYVKVPVTTTGGESCGPIIARLSKSGIKLNITAIMTLDQVRQVGKALDPNVPAIVSVFAGRVADTGRDPIPHMTEALRILGDRPRAELLWASPREVLNVYQADAIGCHIITVTSDLLKKLSLCGKNLEEYSRETVSMFYKDAHMAGVTIPLADTMAIS